jgi:hypothetical protein
MYQIPHFAVCFCRQPLPVVWACVVVMRQAGGMLTGCAGCPELHRATLILCCQPVLCVLTDVPIGLAQQHLYRGSCNRFSPYGVSACNQFEPPTAEIDQKVALVWDANASQTSD